MKKIEKIIGIMDPNGYSFRAAFEGLINFLKPQIEYNGEIHEIITQRISTRPYNVLKAICPYSAIINRGAHWNPHHNSFFMTVGYKSYLLNDMISFTSINKNTSYGHMFKLGFNVPSTIALPQQDYSELVENPKVNTELIFSEHEFFDLKSLGEEVGYPAYLKPQSGGGWIGVTKVNNDQELIDTYNKSGNKPMNLQKAIEYREFVRTVGIGPQMLPMHYNASAQYSHDRYLRSENQAVDFDFLTKEENEEIRLITKVINAFYKWDHNSCETLIGHDGKCYPIDFANAYPDSSVVSLHYYFPDLVKSMVKWMIFCTVTNRKKSFNFAYDWPQYFEINEDKDLSYKEKLQLYSTVADEYFETKKFEDFCDKYLVDFDKKSKKFFASKDFEDIIRQEVDYYFNLPHERPLKVQHYLGINKFWLHCQDAKLNNAAK